MYTGVIGSKKQPTSVRKNELLIAIFHVTGATSFFFFSAYVLQPLPLQFEGFPQNIQGFPRV